MKPKKDDTEVKRKQASEAIKSADMEREMLSKRDDRPVAPAMVQRPAMTPRPAMATRPVAPVVAPRPVVRPSISDEANDTIRPEDMQDKPYKKGGAVKAKSSCMKTGGAVKSGASRGDGISERGRTRGKYC